jgi:hypothetical protein
MLDIIVVALLQAAAGQPAQPPQEQPAQTEAQTQDTQTAAAEARERRRCRAREITGTRLQSLVQCRARGNSEQDQETRDTLHDLQRPSGLQGN